jgi:glycosyltransferase involved in cell wall biosynthesis
LKGGPNTPLVRGRDGDGENGFNKAMAKIAFHLFGNDTWYAGIVYITNLLRALWSMDRNMKQFCILLKSKDSSVPDKLRDLVHEVIVYPSFQRWTASWFMDRGMKRLFRLDLNGMLFLKKHRVKLIAFGDAPHGSKIPTLAWLPDFQHIHFPEMFSSEERQARDCAFLRIAKKSTRIILLSESVRNDFQLFAPEFVQKTRVVRPVSYVPATVYETDPTYIIDSYHLPERFVYLPNQFWKHKNHGAAFQAVRLLKEKGIAIFLVCTGNTEDYRHPNYFQELLQEISRLGIQEHVMFLGLIPREHVFMLIRQSICVLNSSLFEGFGLTADEARSLGKKMLLSDIEAHREQNPPAAIFFDPRDYEDLASKMAAIWNENSPGPDLELEAQARESLRSRAKAFAESFISVVNEILH